jgi:hypothetical protein
MLESCWDKSRKLQGSPLRLGVVGAQCHERGVVQKHATRGVPAPASRVAVHPEEAVSGTTNSVPSPPLRGASEAGQPAFEDSGFGRMGRRWWL